MGCNNSIVINASAEQVWQKLRDFHGMASWAKGIIETCTPEGDFRSNEIGAKRILNGVFKETLLGLDDHNKVMLYSIDDGPDAVAKDKVQGYIGKVRVFPVTENNSSFVSWTSTWASDSGGVADFCNPIYRGLLNALKENLESTT
ncbi:MAG: polyketide cyclase [Methylotenera sp.]|nr:MAG: polyketide cyclase [Methylotenera sp.]